MFETLALSHQDSNILAQANLFFSRINLLIFLGKLIQAKSHEAQAQMMITSYIIY